FTVADQIGSTTIDAINHTVSVAVGSGADITNLIPTIEVSANAIVSPASGVAQDFSAPVTYAVTSEDGTEQEWMVTVEVLSGDNDIISFTVEEQFGATNINFANHTISLNVVSGTDLSGLIPSIEVSKYATINPPSGEIQDFNDTVAYEVKAQDGTIQEWKVSITIQTLSSEKEITAFTFAEQASPAVIDSASQRIEIEVKPGTDITKLIPYISVSKYATITPAPGIAQDFSSPVTYTVKAQNGSTKNWLVTVIVPSSEKDILSFSLAEQTQPANINTDEHSVFIEVEPGTDVTNLTPTIEVSHKATINPGSGVALDLSKPVTYIVTAEDGSTQQWIVVVEIKVLSSQKNITYFSVNGQIGDAMIDTNSYIVAVEVAAGIDVTSLKPSIKISEFASISPDTALAQDFTQPVTYVVTAEDGSTREWLVVVSSSVNITNIERNDLFKLFPNPARANNPVSLAIDIMEVYQVRIFNIHGQLVFTSEFYQGKQSLQLPVHDFKAGIYVVELFNNEHHFGSKQLVITK
ncbi:MAG: DUF5018 domain-containing protein, partial [Bacteroidales bacterium]|nr:DUF5018 domain-containing protein [Bacteroidales bacterium]